jgi:aminoglycoside phosphotransferase (APT) family kinase protein
MAIGAKPAAEVTIDGSLVQALLQEQQPDLAHLSLIEVGEGWDNTLFRLGDDLAVRVPRRAASAALIEHEQRWLPRLSSRLPLPVPAPVRVGRPCCGFPWSWSVVPWFPGQTALLAPPQFGDLAAGDPATDLSVAWMLLPPPARPTFFASARGALDPLDADTLMRARGWALALGLAYLANSQDDEAMGALGRAAINSALSD